MPKSNKRIGTIVLGCALICGLAKGQTVEPTSTAVMAPSLGDNNGYASAALGNGILYGPDIGSRKPMRWRDGEIRFGQQIDLFGLVSSGHIPPGEAPRLDVIYYNEGHPDNNHRDGYALQMVYRKNLHPGFDAEFGAGPYFSMNRTTVNGTEIDDARLGVLFSLALLVRLDQYWRGLHLRFGYNHVSIPGAPSSDALLIGVGKNIDSLSSGTSNEPGHRTAWLGVTGGFAQTNQSGPGKRLSYSVDAKSYSDQWATSVSAIKEGDDGIRVNREGVAVQQWYVQPINENWSISAGVGAYLAANKRQSDNLTLNGLGTIELGRNLGSNWKAIVDFRRVVTFQNRNDADLVTIGLMRRLNF